MTRVILAPTIRTRSWVNGFVCALKIVEHPNQDRYRGQRVIIVQIEAYAYLVPCLREDECVVPKTIIPSRKTT